MCKVSNKYVVCEDGDMPGYADIQNARGVARQRHQNNLKPQVIYMAVEISEHISSPIRFRQVDGVNEN